MLYRNRGLLLSIALVARPATAQPLPALNLDPAATTVSGISSGAFFAVQYQFAHSASVRGAAIVAGGPFKCAQGGGFLEYMACCTIAEAINVSALAAAAARDEAQGLIDPLAGLPSHTTHLFSGTIDSFVSHGTMLALAQLYAELGVPTTDFFNFTAEHAWITSRYGASCSTLAAPFVNDCGLDFSGGFLSAAAAAAGRPWNATPGSYEPANLLNFSQAAFAPVADLNLDALGFVYVPRACAAGERCTLHVNFHGCDQARSELGDEYVRQTQLGDHAEGNHLVILYPQAFYNLTGKEFNPLACWDTWGLDGENYANKQGAQISFVKAVVDALLGG